jgi:hypothetical protein
LSKFVFLPVKITTFSAMLFSSLNRYRKPRRRWEDNIKMDIQEVGVWTGLGWLRIEPGGGHL